MDYSSNNSSNSFNILNLSSSKPFEPTDYSSKESFSPFDKITKKENENINLYIKVLATWISEFADFNTTSAVNLNSKNNLYDNCQVKLLEKQFLELKNLSNFTVVQEFDPFFNPLLPDITMYTYLMRIVKLSEIEYSTLIIACLYIDRIINNKRFKVSWFNIYR